ncbi:Aliphatic sulfonates import ATP-binding protein SsuB [Acaryochloris thomasi RCC1774]|uniref:Aliphatic sulfonates import ATP-binding protein SsuB n=1 Tax=Acaryochloris thomasi RCC1774 TaxID=1764569 RepID=A0A2W1JMY4_9CYAN|nr:ABC transporter ATP-binding protein [Acaryochloris thomasi]PZD74700.1 Aliphatic sulfonates import ATP-binding protein SsuB [Acaryochloris thomasi RCC1774]
MLLNATDISRPLTPPTPIAKLQVQGITKSFRRSRKPLTVLDDVNLHLSKSEFVCIAGASGCGKSTLLNIIAGLLPPCEGQVLVDGEPVPGPGADRGMVFQSYTLYPWLTVANNVAFGLKLRRLPKAQMRERVGYFLNIVGLSAFASAYPKELSGGMKQRVAIARALINGPEVLLMDEPFGALDAQTKEKMQQFMLELWEKTRTSILMITHDLEEAIYLAQRVYVMSAHPGRIQQEIKIDLPPERELDLKLSPKFIQTKRELIESLRAVA